MIPRIRASSPSSSARQRLRVVVEPEPELESVGGNRVVARLVSEVPAQVGRQFRDRGLAHGCAAPVAICAALGEHLVEDVDARGSVAA